MYVIKEEYSYVEVDKGGKSNTTCRALETEEGWMDNGIYIASNENGDLKKGSVTYANIQYSNGTTCEDDSGDGWVDNLIYDSDDEKLSPIDCDKAEGWADNIIYE